MKTILKTTAVLLSVMLVFTMMPLTGIGVQKAHAVSAPGGAVASNNTANLDTVKVETVTAETAFGGSSNVDAAYDNGSKTLTITLKNDITLSAPVRFVKGANGEKIVLDLNGHTITGSAGATTDDFNASFGGNAIEIAADEYDVEIKGPGKVIGGKGGKWNRPDYMGFRLGIKGGSAVFFCERVDKVHGTTSQWGSIIDEGYHPGKLEHGLTVTGGANLIGGAGADVTLEDWKYNLGIGDEDIFRDVAGAGGSAIGQVFNDIETENVFEELSYAKIDIKNGTVKGGAGGNVNLGDQLLTTTDIQKIDEIRQFMAGKSDDYDFDSHVTSAISFKPGNGGNGIEFFAGRKFVEVGSSGTVSGGDGGRFTCGEQAAMVKSIGTKCGDGGIGISVSGDTGLTNTKPDLTADNWSSKDQNSDDAGIYVAGTVTGGASPSTTLRADSTGNGGEGIDSDFEPNHLTGPYSIESGHKPTFDADRGIVVVDSSGKVCGGASGAPDETTISGGTGGEGITGGSTGSPTGGTRMTAAYFVINGEVTGGYGSSHGGDGFYMKKEQEYLDDTQSSTYFSGIVYGNGTIRGGDAGEWPYLSPSYTADESGAITEHLNSGDRLVCSEGIRLAFGITERSATIGSDFSVSDGMPARLMKTQGTFKVTPTMTSFPLDSAPTADTKLSCEVTTPDGYTGKVYILWTAEYENTNPRSVREIEGANGAYNNFGLLGHRDYPYGWYTTSYGNAYHINVATYDHMAESIKYNDSTEVHIYCKAMLEDGRYAENDDIWFSKQRRSSKGWSGGSGGDDPSGPTTADYNKANAVIDLIDDLPAADKVTLHDAEAVAYARAQYEALTDVQKGIVDAYVMTKERLEAAEAVIADLTAADTVTNQIADLVDALKATDDEGKTADQVIEAKAAAATAINDARTAYDTLTDAQKALVPNANTLTAAEALIASAYEADYQAMLSVFIYNNEPVDLSGALVTVSDEVYTGFALTPQATVTLNGNPLTEDTDYKVTYGNNINAGNATVKIEGKGYYTGIIETGFKINKAANTLKVSGRTATVKYSKLKKKTLKLGVTKVLNFTVPGQGTMKYVKYAGNKKIKINKTTGKVTIKKKLKKGTYKVKVKVVAGGGKNYNSSGVKKVIFKIKVK